jgi:hypothetical protein
VTIASSPPEPGQIVQVRALRFVVADVNRGALPSGPLAEGLNHAQHLVTLTSIEDDALGEELQVVWELEPGARVLDDANLADLTGFDTPARLDAFLDAVRWGAASSADVRALWAPFRSGVDIKDYQLDPLVRAIQMPRVNLLIADDVGFGKTIETGLVLQEMLIRHRARRVLIICPSALQIHWRDQMREKFGLEFRIVDADLLKQLRRERGLHVNPWSHFPRLITSIDFIKRDRPMRLLREILPAEGESVYPRRIDMLIVDEAHNVAPSGRGHYAIDSLRTQAIRAITPHCEHRLFLTATPHNGYQESFTALLELIDNQRFARGVAPDEAQKRTIMVRRMKSELTDWTGQPLFPARQCARWKWRTPRRSARRTAGCRSIRSCAGGAWGRKTARRSWARTRRATATAPNRPPPTSCSNCSRSVCSRRRPRLPPRWSSTGAPCRRGAARPPPLRPRPASCASSSAASRRSTPKMTRSKKRRSMRWRAHRGCGRLLVAGGRRAAGAPEYVGDGRHAAPGQQGARVDRLGDKHRAAAGKLE